MDNVILKRLVTSILALSLATNGNISLASSPVRKITDLNKREGRVEVDEDAEEETEIEEEEDISRRLEAIEEYEEEMKSKLSVTLLDPSKQDRIEVKIIKRLISLDTAGVFSDIFNKVLLECEKIRTPYKDPRLGLVYSINIHGKIQTITESNFKDSRSAVQSVLGREIGAVAWEILDNLYNPENQAMALNMIRELNVMQTAEEFSSYNILFERINQVFYHSRRLLTVTIAPQIIEKYVLDTIGTTKQPTNLSFETVEEENNKKQECKFMVDGDEYICEFLVKKEGKFFGSVVEVRAIDGSKANRYYLKAHQGYPAVNKKDSNASYFDTTAYSTTLKTVSADDKPIVKLNYVDLREPFMYKVLEQLGYGPRTYIMINPFINYGLYIVTEDLNSGSNVFFNIEGLKSRIGLVDLLNPIISSNAKDVITTDLTEVSILSYMFNLCDLHSQNWGYIATEEAYDELKAEKAPSSGVQVRIIDFLLSKDAPVNPLEEKFLRGQIPGANGTFSQVLGTLGNYLDAFSRGRIRKEQQETFKKLFEIKIQQGETATRQLYEHIQSRKIHDVIEKTKGELLERLGEYPLICGILKPDETSMESAAVFTNPLAAHRDPYMELEKYCENIYENYARWNKFIAGGYIQWLDELLKKVPEKKE